MRINSSVFWVSLLGVLYSIIVTACGVVDQAPLWVEEDDEELVDGDADFAVDTGLQDELRDMLSAYVHGLERGDAAAVEGLLSAELLSRIAERAPGADAGHKMQAFVLGEQRKLAKSLGSLRSRSELFTVTSARKLEEGRVVALTVSLGGEEIPKPFYFVAQDGGYKLNVTPPVTSLSSDSYMVGNADYVWRNYGCSGVGSAMFSIGPYPAAQYTTCNNSCSSWFDGTRFFTQTGSAYCDYNSFGLDMWIKNGLPVCNDPC
jgi:hypothetical protein